VKCCAARKRWVGEVQIRSTDCSALRSASTRAAGERRAVIDALLERRVTSASRHRHWPSPPPFSDHAQEKDTQEESTR